MQQTKTASILEVFANVALSAITSLLLNRFFLPVLGIHVSGSQNLEMVLVFTLASLIRLYVLRRVFNWISEQFD